jgi:beta-xylosidase
LSCFDDSASVSSLRIYTSNDALNFTLLADTGYAGPTGNLRDPSILKHTDGKFYVAFTTPPSGTGCCGAETSFSIAQSSDLRNWTTLTTVPSGIAGATNVWAPDWFKDTDGTLHIWVSIAVNGGGKKSYRYEPTDATLTKWSGGTFIGIGPNNIDTYIVKVGSTYHAFTKNEDTKYIEHATATSIDGAWSFDGTGDWAGWGSHREGPALLDLGNGTWRLFCDGYGSGYEMYSDSSDTFKTWTALKALPGAVGRISHGAVIKGN